MPEPEPTRCGWAVTPLDVAYHDTEWGVPVHGDDRLFELLTLEGAQAGLSWTLVLRKRPRYREVFAGFAIDRVARFTPARIEKILADPGIVRNRAKVLATVENARAAQRVREEFGSFDAFLWSFVGGTPIRNARRSFDEEPATLAIAERMSRDLRKRGFRFVGPTIVYAFMQAAGMVDDHLVTCFRYGAGRAPE